MANRTPKPHMKARTGTDWASQAACRDADPDLFFGPPGEGHASRAIREARAKTVCAQCPVRLSCREEAMRYKDDAGVWGGLGEDERATKRRTWLKKVARERAGQVA